MNRLGLRWWIISLVTIGTVLNYLARSSLSVAAPTLKQRFAMSTQEYSWVVASFQAAYTVMQPIAGYVLDSLGLRLGFALFAIGWSTANCLHAFAGGWPSLAMFRGLLGLTEAAAIPAGMKAVSDWFPPRERTVATGWFNVGSSIGAMIAPPVVVFCIAVWGWQSAFMVTGGVGFLFAAVWYIFYRKPEDHPRISDEERALIVESRPVVDTAAGMSSRAIMRMRQFWAIALPRFLADPAWQTFNFFIPLYLVEAKGMDLKSVAAFAWLPFLAADLGSIVGGYYAPWLMRRFNVPLITSRKIVVASGSVLMIGPALIGLTVSPAVAIALFCVGGFAHQMLSGALITLSADLFRPEVVGKVTGMAGSAAWIGGLSFSLVIGSLADTIGYNPLFVCLALFDLLGTAILFSLLKHGDPQSGPPVTPARAPL
ncbi:MFS transporter [Sphingomonas silueang]|uniref:MFS transporter n=1 Tax=Sphingomonas silueang TaxID=3156617 RepID=UPI0032B6035E